MTPFSAWWSVGFGARDSRGYCRCGACTFPSDALTVGLRLMTTYGHNMTMKTVRIAELKARLSEYLRAVRRGETIAVLDRDTPVAQIVPVRDRTALRIRKPAPGTPRPNEIPLPKPLKLEIDTVDLLLEERQAHR